MALTPEQALVLVDELYRTIRGRRGDIEKYDDYYRGKHPLVMASEVWQRFHESRYQHFSDNWCGVVADSSVQRNRLTGFGLDSEGDVSDAERGLWDDWRRNEMDVQSVQGFLETVKSKRSFVMVWSADSDGTPEVTWESPDQVAVGYDPERPRQRKAALKCWGDDEYEYATLYTPEWVYKFSRVTSKARERAVRAGLILPVPEIGGNQWAVREVSGEPWPIRNPLGVVPVVEFPNRAPLTGEPLSDIGGVAAMQDAINLLWAYLFAAADHASFPARVVLGMEAPSIPKLDENGNDTGQRIPVDLTSLAQGRMLFLNQDGKDPKIGQWDAAKLDVFTNTVEVAVGHIAAQTRTPQHYLILGRNANPPSADALKAAEAGLVAKVLQQQTYASPSVREVFRLMAMVRGDMGLAEACRLGRVLWEDAENRSDAQKADAANKWRAVGLSVRGIVERYWTNDPNEVDRQMEMIEDEADDPTMQRIMREVRGVAGGPQQQEPAQVSSGDTESE